MGSSVLEWVVISFFTDLLDSGIKPASPALAGGFFTTGPHGKPQDRGGIQKLSLTGPTFSLWLLKKRSFHVLRHREAIPAHTWVNLDSMLTNIYVT